MDIKKYRKDKYIPDNEYLISKNIISQSNQLTSGLEMFSDKYNSDLSLVTCRLWNGYDKGVDEALRQIIVYLDIFVQIKLIYIN